jgi:hypothetical protein
LIDRSPEGVRAHCEGAKLIKKLRKMILQFKNQYGSDKSGDFTTRTAGTVRLRWR